MQPTRPYLFAFLCALLLLSPRLAFAGCTKDTDCKGDRICVQEACVDPPATSGVQTAPAPGIPDVNLRFASQRRGAAQRGIGGTWVLFGWGAAATAVFAGTIGPGLAEDLDDDAPVHFIAYGVGSLFFASTGPVASVAGGEARRGLDRLGLDGTGADTRSAGFGLYAASMGLMAGSFGALAGFIDQGDSGGCYDETTFMDDADCIARRERAHDVFGGVFAGLALSTCATSLISTALFQADAIAHRRLLLDGIDDARAGRLGLQLRGVGPWFAPTEQGAAGGISVLASW